MSTANNELSGLKAQLTDKDRQISQLRAQVEQLEQQVNLEHQAVKYLDILLDHLPLGIAILYGPELKYFRVNQYLADINNLTVEEHLNRPLLEVLPHLEKSIIPLLTEVMETGKSSEQREFEVVQADGSTKQLLDFHHPIGKDVVLCMVLDITEHNSMVEVVNRSKEKLESNMETLKATQHQLIQTAKLASIGQLTAGLAHELNQPLGRIYLTAELIHSMIDREGPVPKARVGELLQRILRDVKSANGLMSHLRMYSRQDVSTIQETIELHPLINELLVLFNHKIKLLNIDFKLNLNPIEGELTGDPGQIEQVINNLMSNAIDALKNQPVRELSLSTFERKNQICIEVKDTGCGMTRAVLNNMFDPFFTTKESGEGTGLGLSIIKGIVENHHGAFDVQSTPGKGTCIRVDFPRA